MASPQDLCWVVLTRGDRPDSLAKAVRSLHPDRVLVVLNGGGADLLPGVEMVVSSTNIGIPAGRDRGLRAADSRIVGFLDDDAVACEGAGERISGAFRADPGLGAVALRIVDEDGNTSRRHVPRFGRHRAGRGGEVALFLGGACALRREAYDDAGGYWHELFYGHEELELSWRLVDRGWSIRYLADAVVFHPRTEVGRHADGWRMTGRNRVMIARRTLPWPVAFLHVALWLVVGAVRAPAGPNRCAYVHGWRSGWSVPVERHPIRWRTVWRLTLLGRPPLL